MGQRVSKQADVLRYHDCEYNNGVLATTTNEAFRFRRLATAGCALTVGETPC